MDISLSPTSSLGTPSSHEYRAGFGIWLYGFFSIVLMLVGFAGIAYMILSTTFLVLELIVILAAFSIAAFFAFLVYNSSTRRVQVYEQGFTYTKGKTTHTFRWDEIEAVWQHIVTYRVRVLIFYVPVSTGYKYTIRKKSGDTINLTNSIGKVGELGTLIQQQVLKQMMPRAVETYNNGGTLQFGKLSISQMGIDNGKETIPWDQVKGVQFANGHITIQKAGKWLRWAGVDASKVPNLFLFVALVDRIVGVSR